MEKESRLPKGFFIKSPRAEYKIEKCLKSNYLGNTYLAVRTISHNEKKISTLCCLKEYLAPSKCTRDERSMRVIPLKDRGLDFEIESRQYGMRSLLLKALLHHPNLVKFTETFLANGTSYYVTEFCEGMNLTEYVLSYGPMSKKNLLQLLYPLMSGVDYLHFYHINHGDITPANIVVKKEPGDIDSPVLIDFDTSKGYDRDSNMVMGLRYITVSRAFSPREQYCQVSSFRPTLDIYAICAVFLFGLTKRLPLDSTSIDYNQLRPLWGTSIKDPYLRALIRGMHPDPSKRQHTVRQLMNELSVYEDESEEFYKELELIKPIFLRPEIKVEALPTLDLNEEKGSTLEVSNREMATEEFSTEEYPAQDN